MAGACGRCLLEDLARVKLFSVEQKVSFLTEVIDDQLLGFLRLRVEFRPLVRLVIHLQVLRHLQKQTEHTVLARVSAS